VGDASVAQLPDRAAQQEVTQTHGREVHGLQVTWAMINSDAIHTFHGATTSSAAIIQGTWTAKTA
jgi:hypothetical protein